MRQQLVLGFIILTGCIIQPMVLAETNSYTPVSPELLRQLTQLKSQNQQLQQRVQQLQGQVQSLQQNSVQQNMRLQRLEKWVVDRSRPGKILNP